MFKRLIASVVCLTFSISNIQSVQAQPGLQQVGDFNINQLPVPGTMVGESQAFSPLALKGLVVNLNKPLEFQFIVDTGSSSGVIARSASQRSEATKQSQKEQLSRLVKYFLTGLTIPEGDLWVNLSPYEKNRMVPQALGQTELGRDLLAQDYILKQLTASLIYPEKDLGKEFWSRVYAKAQEQFGTTNVPVDTFNKVWILPDQAQVFENHNAAYITQSTLKVMLDEDYLALSKHASLRGAEGDEAISNRRTTNSLGSQIVRQIILPEIQKEVNQGQNFAPLRQIYQALILAKWYKETIQNGLLDTIYNNKKKIAGVNLNDPTIKEKIYQRYLRAYKKGVFNYIKEDPTPEGQIVPRKYFSGGTVFLMNLGHTHSRAMLSKSLTKLAGRLLVVLIGLGPVVNPTSALSDTQAQESPAQYDKITSTVNLSDEEFQRLMDFYNAKRTFYDDDDARIKKFVESGDKRMITPIAKWLSKGDIQVNDGIHYLERLGAPRETIFGAIDKGWRKAVYMEMQIMELSSDNDPIVLEIIRRHASDFNNYELMDDDHREAVLKKAGVGWFWRQKFLVQFFTVLYGFLGLVIVVGTIIGVITNLGPSEEIASYKNKAGSQKRSYPNNNQAMISVAERNILNNVLTTFGINRYSSPKRMELGFTNEFHPISFATPDGKRYLIRRYNLPTPQIRFINSVVNQLRAKGLPVPRLLKPQEAGDDFFVEFEGHKYVVEEFMKEGNYVPTQQLLAQHFASIGRLGARIQNVLQGFQPQGEKHYDAMGDKVQRDILQGFGDLDKESQRPLIGKNQELLGAFHQVHPLLVNQLNQFKANYDPHKLVDSIIFGDLNPGNIKFNAAGEITALFDFNFTQTDKRVYEFNNMVFGMDDENTAVSYSYERLLRTAQAYDESLSHPLSEDEIKAIIEVIRFRLIRDIYKYFVLNNPKIPFNAFQFPIQKPNALNALKRLEAFVLDFDSPAKVQEFVRNVKNHAMFSETKITRISNQVFDKGGIDLNQINVHRMDKVVKVQFDPAQLNELVHDGFEGFTPVFIRSTYISNPYQLLGVNPA